MVSSSPPLSASASYNTLSLSLNPENDLFVGGRKILGRVNSAAKGNARFPSQLGKKYPSREMWKVSLNIFKKRGGEEGSPDRRLFKGSVEKKRRGTRGLWRKICPKRLQGVLIQRTCSLWLATFEVSKKNSVWIACNFPWNEGLDVLCMYAILCTECMPPSSFSRGIKIMVLSTFITLSTVTGERRRIRRPA